MSEEDAFLASIREEPEEESNRVAYADWLEERGDVRGEFLRLEHEMRVRGVDHESRLRALRSELDPNWLWAVHDGRLGSDWAVVLQSFGMTDHAVDIRVLCEAIGMSLTEAQDAVRSLPQELKRGLRYWQAHQLRHSLRDVGYATVECRRGG